MPLYLLAEFDIANIISLEGDDGRTFDQTAPVCDLYAHLTKRIFKAAITYHVFKEQPAGTVRHNAASRYRATNSEIRRWMLMVFEELWPSGTKVGEAIGKFGRSQEPNETASRLAYRTEKGFFGFMDQYPDRLKRFANATTCISSAHVCRHTI